MNENHTYLVDLNFVTDEGLKSLLSSYDDEVWRLEDDLSNAIISLRIATEEHRVAKFYFDLAVEKRRLVVEELTKREVKY